jgi:hypothetical protein
MVISGGQTGADEAGLRAAKVLGYKTGGMMPHGWKTEAGPRPEFHRTRYNIRAADATIVFFLNRSDGGTGLTMAACMALVKPLTTCEWPEGGTMFHPDPAYVQRWIRGLRIKTLNIAGNRESKSPGIGARVEAFLLEALQR